MASIWIKESGISFDTVILNNRKIVAELLSKADLPELFGEYG
ncbi:MAG: hypothetical protein AB8B66_03195 [Rickettsiaceae bacterium]